MNPEIKALWLEALRSGEYEQGIGALHSYEDGKDYYCCLGVLCDLAIKAGVDVQEESRTPVYAPEKTSFSYDGEEAFLPYSVQQWAGMEDDNVSFRTEEGELLTAVSMNDDLGFSFQGIANNVERYL